jgi:dihydroorotase
MDLVTLWRALSLNPAKLLGLEVGRMSEGAPADLVLFDPEKPFVMDRYALKSRCKNTPFDTRRMQGVVFRTFVGGEEVYAR